MDKHHKHLDSLRGLAILMVMGFHFWPTVFKGGYIGVDFFFVISGFVLMGSLQRSQNAPEFIWKRILRLVPAVWFLCLFMIGFSFFLPKNIALDVINDALKSSVFATSFFEIETPGYFEGSFQNHFFTHMWSLSVEMQISLILGLGLILYAFVQKRLLWPTVAVGGLSFLLFILPIFSELERYFLAPFRFWAFALGMGLALWVTPKKSNPPLLLGGALLVLSLALGQKDFILPGAAVASFSIALFIAFGPHFYIRPLVALGKISYGVYLWHVPLLVLTYALFDTTNPSTVVLWVLGSVLLGWFSFHVVERPSQKIGKKITSLSARSGTIFLGTAALLVLALFPLSLTKPGPAPQHDAFATCHHFSEAPEKDCLVPNAPYFFWGDSHMGTLAGPVTEWRQNDTAQASFLSQNGCPPRGPLMGETLPKTPTRVLHEQYCKDTQNLGWEQIPHHDTVVLTAHFLRHIRSDHCGMSCPVFDDFASLVQDIQDKGKRVVVLGPVPEVEQPAFFTQAIRHVFGREIYDVPRAQVDEKLQEITSWLNTLPVQIIWPVDALCTDTVCSALNAEAVPYFFDTDHLSSAGADVVFEHIKNEIEKQPDSQ